MSIGFPGNNWPVNSRIPALPTTNLTRPAAYQLPAASTAPIDAVEITPQIAVGIRIQGADTGQWGNNKQFASFSSDEASQLFNQLVEYANNLTPQEVYKSSVNRDEIGAVLKQLNAPNVDVDNRFFAFVSAMYDQNNYKEITTDDGTLNYFRAPEMTLDLLKRQYDDMAPADQFTVYYQPFNKVPPPPTSKYDVGNKTTDDHVLRISADKAQQYFTRLQTRSVYENNYGEVYGLPYIDDHITLQELSEEITRVSKDPSQTASSDNSDYLSFLQSLKSNFSEVAVSSPLMGTTGSGVTGGSVTGSLGVYGNLDPVNGNSGSGVISSGSGSVRPQTTGGVRPSELVITRESFMAQLDDDGNTNNYTASYRVDKPVPQPQRVDMGADMVFAGGATAHKFAASEVTTALQFVTMLTGQTHFSNDMLSRLSDVFKPFNGRMSTLFDGLSTHYNEILREAQGGGGDYGQLVGFGIGYPGISADMVKQQFDDDGDQSNLTFNLGWNPQPLPLPVPLPITAPEPPVPQPQPQPAPWAITAPEPPIPVANATI